MATVQLGYPHKVAWKFVDGDGSPVTSGLTASATLHHATGINGDTIATIPLAHEGGGVWSASILATYVDDPGLYYARVASVTGGITLGALVKAFTVGDGGANRRTMREVMRAVYYGLEDITEGAVTETVSVVAFKDAARADAGLAENEWIGSQLYLPKATPLGGPDVVAVTDFDPADGEFTHSPATNGAATIGHDYWLVNHKGAGYEFWRVWRTVADAALRLGGREAVEDTISLTAASDTYRYEVPRPWVAVDRVWYDRNATRTDVADPRPYRNWKEIAPSLFDFDPETRQLLFTSKLPLAGRALKIRGRIEAEEPLLATSPVPVDYGLIVDTVVGELLLPGRDRAAVVLQRAEGQRRGLGR